MGPVGIGQGPGQPGIAVGIEAVVPTQRGGDFAHGLIHLDSAIDGVFLVPQQAASDVHVFEGEGVLGADQCGQLTDQDRGVLPRLQLQIGDRQRAIEVGHRLIGGEERNPEIRNIVGARLQVELKPAVGLLNEYLPVAQGRLRVVIARHVIPRPHAQTVENAVHGDLAERSGVEDGWGKSRQRTCYGWRGERCRGWRRGWGRCLSRGRFRRGGIVRRRQPSARWPPLPSPGIPVKRIATRIFRMSLLL